MPAWSIHALLHLTFGRFALDLVEVFFQIVHTRLPLLNPEQFRSRLQLHPEAISNSPPLHPALVATVIAWGTKFSEHPVLVADRRRPGGQSHLARTLVDRARDLAEALKVHRIPTSDHVVISLLLEPLQNRASSDSLFDIADLPCHPLENPDDPNGNASQKIIASRSTNPSSIHRLSRILDYLCYAPST